MTGSQSTWQDRCDRMQSKGLLAEDILGLARGSIKFDYSGNPVLSDESALDAIIAKLHHEALVDRQELARRLGKSYGYVSKAVAFGFPMPGGVASVDEFRKWHSENPDFSKAAADALTSKRSRPKNKCTRAKKGQTAR